MVFWISVLIFLGSIMTYMFFPRSDQYQINMHREEANVVSFVNQHQAAKDLMYQMISWNPSTTDNIYPLPYQTSTGLYLGKMIPDVMNEEDIYTVGGEAKANPNPKTAGAGGHYTSAIVCLEKPCSPESETCVRGKKLTTCPSDEQYIITYGYMPTWWSDKTDKNQAWFRALLKRTHGSVGCGILAPREGGLYSIDNSQKYSGYETLDSKRVVAPIITKKLEAIGLDTCDEDDTSCTEKLKDLMFCMTPFQNPYLGEPIFHWDKINNNKVEHVDATGIPLIGTLNAATGLVGRSSGTMPTTNYTFAGVVPQPTGTVLAGEQVLVRLNSTTNLLQKCESGKCQLIVRQNPSTELISVTDIPEEKGVSFIYTVTTGATKQKLTVFYHELKEEKDKDDKIITEKDQRMLPGKTTLTEVSHALVQKVLTKKEQTSATAGPTLSEPKMELSGTGPVLWDLRVYDGSPLTEREIARNAKSDLNRFGL